MKAALIYSFKPSEWFSCTIINKNLRSAYELLCDEAISIDYTRKREVSDGDLQKLADSDIEHLVFIDHQPPPTRFLIELKRVSPECFQRLKYTIHIFGDFPLFLGEWRTVFSLLEDLPVKLVCASEKQKKFIEKFVEQKSIIEVSPFPVDTKQFNYDEVERERTREELEFGGDFVFLYTGRLSLQKNTVELVEEFCQSYINKVIPKESKLYIVGPMDNLGLPFIGMNQLQGEYFRSIERTLSRFPNVRNRIFFTGKVSNELLIKFYLAADCFVSLSVYHDEDYGMSVAEALCSGLPAIITDWAGYKSFQLEPNPEFCRLVGTSLGSKKPSYLEEDFRHEISQVIRKNYSRHKIASLYAENFGVESVSQRLKGFLDSPFIKFGQTTSFMKRLTNEQLMRGRDFLKCENNRNFSRLYFEAYDVYAE